MCNWKEKSISEEGKSVDKDQLVVFTSTTTRSSIDSPDSNFAPSAEKHPAEASSVNSGEWTTTLAPRSENKSEKTESEATKNPQSETTATTEKSDRRKHPTATKKATTSATNTEPTDPTTLSEPDEKSETTTIATTYLTTTVDNPQSEKPSVVESDVQQPSDDASNNGEVKLITTNRTMPSEKMLKEADVKKTTEAPTSTTSIAESHLTKPDLEVKVSGCFEVIEGYAMRGAAGALEHDVTLEECECFCANSL